MGSDAISPGMLWRSNGGLGLAYSERGRQWIEGPVERVDGAVARSTLKGSQSMDVTFQAFRMLVEKTYKITAKTATREGDDSL